MLKIKNLLNEIVPGIGLRKCSIFLDKVEVMSFLKIHNFSFVFQSIFLVDREHPIDNEIYCNSP